MIERERERDKMWMFQKVNKIRKETKKKKKEKAKN